MTVAKNQGLTRAKEIYQDRTGRIKELKAEGKKIVGYIHIYPVITYYL